MDRKSNRQRQLDFLGCVFAQMRRCVGPEKRVAYAVLLCMYLWMGGEDVLSFIVSDGLGLDS